MRPPHPVQRFVQRFVASGTVRMRPALYNERFVAPIGSSTEAPSGTAHMRPTRPIWQFTRPVQRFGAPCGAPLEAQPGPSACVPRTQFGIFTYPVQRFVAP
eukprot:9501891-Pyramimonas_sp.AAC.1